MLVLILGDLSGLAEQAAKTCCSIWAQGRPRPQNQRANERRQHGKKKREKENAQTHIILHWHTRSFSTVPGDTRMFPLVRAARSKTSVDETNKQHHF